MRSLTISLSVLSFLFTVLPFIRSPAWWIRIFDFPRVQVAVLTGISLILLFNYTDINSQPVITIFVILSATLLYQLANIVKFTPLFPVNAVRARGRENAFSIMQANVKMDNREAAKLKQLIDTHKPDIISLNETDEWWTNELADLEAAYPYSIKQPLNNTYGMMLLSKFELREKKVNFLIDKEIPSFFSTVILPSGSEFHLHCLHPVPPQPGTSTYERDTEILIVGKKIKETDKPAIVVGDLNDVAWSYTTRRFRKYSGVVDPRIGRGTFNTYNAYIPLFRYPLDHFFYSKQFGLISLNKLDAFGSDHFPMFIALNFEPALEGEQKS